MELAGWQYRGLTLPCLGVVQAQVPGSFKANPIPTVNKKQSLPADFFQKCYMKGYLRTLPKKQRIWCMIHENNVRPHPAPSPLRARPKRKQPPHLPLDGDSGHPPRVSRSRPATLATPLPCVGSRNDDASSTARFSLSLSLSLPPSPYLSLVGADGPAAGAG